MLLFIGILLLIPWAVIALAVRRPWQLWEQPVRRIGEIRSAAELVKITGRASARTAGHVYAPLSGDEVLFFSFEGMSSSRHARRVGTSINRRRGVPFFVDDGSGVAFVSDPTTLEGSSKKLLTVLEWDDPGTVADVERRLGQSFAADAQRLQGRELTVSDGQQVTLIARAQREGDLVMLSPWQPNRMLLSTESEPGMSRQILRGRRLLRAWLAVGLILVATGAWLALP